jgi:hypothetical protein
VNQGSRIIKEAHHPLVNGGEEAYQWNDIEFLFDGNVCMTGYGFEGRAMSFERIHSEVN